MFVWRRNFFSSGGGEDLFDETPTERKQGKWVTFLGHAFLAHIRIAVPNDGKHRGRDGNVTGRPGERPIAHERWLLLPMPAVVSASALRVQYGRIIDIHIEDKLNLI